MKNVLFLIAFFSISAFSSLSAQDAVAVATSIKAEVATIEWDQTTFEFGQVPQNVPAKATFKLTNNGDKPLILKEVKPTCGCTIAAYDQEPILPGESTEITTTYNAKKAGSFQKRIKVFTNQSEEYIPLTLKGEVVTE